MSDPYLYSDTNILVNIPNIKDQHKLDEFENTVVNLTLMQMIKGGFVIRHTLNIFDIHKLLFSEIYSWAGETKTINIEKTEEVLYGLSVRYENKNDILLSLTELHNQFYVKDWRKMSETSLIYELSRYISTLWKIHPFREGNTRTVTTFMYFFLNQNGYTLDTSLLKKHSAYFRNALVMSCLEEYSEYNYLEDILMDSIISNKTIEDKSDLRTNKYEVINHVKMEDYKYNYHHKKD